MSACNLLGGIVRVALIGGSTSGRRFGLAALGRRAVLTRLAGRDPQAARLVNLHCFAGLPIEQAAAVLGISPRTAYRDWAFAQAWLYREIRGTEPPAEE